MHGNDHERAINGDRLRDVWTQEEAAEAVVSATLEAEQARMGYLEWLEAHPAPILEFFAADALTERVRTWYVEARKVRQRWEEAVQRAEEARRVLSESVADELPVEAYCFALAFVEIAVEVDGAAYAVVVCPTIDGVMIVPGD